MEKVGKRLESEEDKWIAEGDVLQEAEEARTRFEEEAKALTG